MLATPPSPGSSQAFASLISGWLGKVPPLPLNTVTAAFRAVYLCPVGRRLGSESHLIHSKLWSVILKSIAKRKNPSNNSGGLGSWREQQQTNEANQKLACRLTRPPQVSEGLNDSASFVSCHTDKWIINTTIPALQYLSRKLFSFLAYFMNCWWAHEAVSM